MCWCCWPKIIQISPCLTKLQLAKLLLVFWDTVYPSVKISNFYIIIIIITDLYSAFRSEDTEALDAAQLGGLNEWDIFIWYFRFTVYILDVCRSDITIHSYNVEYSNSACDVLRVSRHVNALQSLCWEIGYKNRSWNNVRKPVCHAQNISDE